MPKIKIEKSSLKRATKQISQEWYKIMRQQDLELHNEGTEEIQQAVEFLKVVDTKNLKGHSKMDQTGFDTTIVWKFYTDDSVEYATHPRNGTGTSTAYGPRKYDLRAAIQMIRKYKLKTVKGAPLLPEAGRPRAKVAKNRAKKLENKYGVERYTARRAVSKLSPKGFKRLTRKLKK